MRFYNVTEFKAKATAIIAEVESKKVEVVITKNGRPVALVRPLDEGEFMLKSKSKGEAHGKS